MSVFPTGSETEPEASAGTLTSTIGQVRQDIAAGKFRSEADISVGVVSRILDKLDWPVFDVQVVAREFKIGTRKVDYALCHAPGEPLVLLEVKDLGKASGKGEKQLFEYCFLHGVPIAVLTDGQKWSFYCPLGLGSYEERRFARVDLVSDDPGDAARTLTSYLQMKDVRSGEARNRAERAYEAARQQRKAAAAYPSVWRELLKKPDPSLCERFSEEVKKTTGIRPNPTDVKAFLRAQSGLAAKPSGNSNEGRKIGPQVPSIKSQPSLTLHGRTETFKSGAAVMIAVFEKLASEDPEFCERFSQKFYGHTRRYVAKTKAQLYPDSPQFQGMSHPLPGGWWLATHCSTRTKVRRIKHACKVAGLEFGKDLVVHIPTRTTK